MKMLVCFGLIFVLLYQADGFKAPARKSFAFHCPRGRVLGSIQSSYSLHKFDRRFQLGCSSWTVPTGRCYWSAKTQFKNGFSATCSCGQVVAGIQSSYNYLTRDRTYRFRCCSIRGWKIYSCRYLTGHMMNQINLRLNHYWGIQAVFSKYNCMHRKFAFKICKMRGIRDYHHTFWRRIGRTRMRPKKYIQRRRRRKLSLKRSRTRRKRIGIGLRKYRQRRRRGKLRLKRRRTQRRLFRLRLKKKIQRRRRTELRRRKRRNRRRRRRHQKRRRRTRRRRRKRRRRRRRRRNG